MKLAKVRHRVIATLLDNVIIIGVMLVLLLGVWPSILSYLVNDFEINFNMVVTLVRAGMFYSLFLLFYYMIVPIFLKGQTIGKWLFKIKVVTDEGKDVDYKDLFFREAICRILVRTISLGVSSIVSFIIMLIREDKKSIADVFSKTKVIDIKEEIVYANSAQ